MKNYLIAVDGGGTKTEFCISDMEGNPIRSYFRGTTNYKSVGLESMALTLKLGLNDILNDLRIEKEDIAYIVFGISGLDSDKDYNKILKEIEQLNIPSENFYLCNDGLLSFYSAADNPGIIVVSGTGSIVLGIDRTGLIKRSGGWGYPFSSLGSGFYIGNELLKKTLLYCDGNYAYSDLFQKVKNHYRIKEFEDLPYRITDITNFYDIADVSKIVTDGSNKDEPLAIEILQDAAAYLAWDVKNVYKKLNFKIEEEISIVFSGGTLEGDLYKAILKAKINEELKAENIKFIKQETTPARGGIRFAKKLYQEKECKNEKTR